MGLSGGKKCQSNIVRPISAMKVLLLHPEDRLPPAQSQGWDLIVDLGRAPAVTYEIWSQQTGCRVINLFQYGRGFEDLYRFKQAIHQGNGLVVDKYGIDWWDVVLPMFLRDMERCFMLLVLADKLDNSARLYCSRPDGLASALQKFLGTKCLPLEGGRSAFARKIQHYREALSRLDFDQLAQIAKDKFDPRHWQAGDPAPADRFFFCQPATSMSPAPPCPTPRCCRKSSSCWRLRGREVN